MIAYRIASTVSNVSKELLSADTLADAIKISQQQFWEFFKNVAKWSGGEVYFNVYCCVDADILLDINVGKIMCTCFEAYRGTGSELRQASRVGLTPESFAFPTIDDLMMLYLYPGCQCIITQSKIRDLSLAKAVPGTVAIVDKSTSWECVVTP